MVGIEAGGMLRFSTAQTTRLTTGVLLVMPGGTLEVGTPAAPCPPAHRGDRHQEPAAQPRGRPRTSTAPGSSAWTAGDAARRRARRRSCAWPRAPGVGATLAVAGAGRDRLAGGGQARPPGLGAAADRGHRRAPQLQPGGGRSSRASRGTAGPWRFPGPRLRHPGTTDEDADGQPDYLPHVANLARNVVVRSECRTGTRGHVFLTHRANVDVRYAAFVDLGPHDLRGPRPGHQPHRPLLPAPAPPDAALSPPSTPSTSSAWWATSVHEDARDDAAAEVGDRHPRLPLRPRPATTWSTTSAAPGSSPRTARRASTSSTTTSWRASSATAAATRPTRPAAAWPGRASASGSAGPNNHVTRQRGRQHDRGRGRVEAAYGFKYNMTYLGNVRVPNFRGADTYVAGQYTDRATGNGLPLLEFASNETYGQIQGLTFWWLCTRGHRRRSPAAPQSVLRDIVIWHTSRYAYYGYPGFNYMFDGTQGLRRSRHRRRQQLRVQERLLVRRLRRPRTCSSRTPRFYNTAGLNPPYFRDGSIRVENSFFKTRGGIIHKQERRRGELPELRPSRRRHGGERTTSFVAVAGRPLRSVSLDPDSPPTPPTTTACSSATTSGRRRQLRGVLPVAGQRPLHRHAAGRRGLRLRDPRGRPRLHPPLRRRLRIPATARAGPPRPPSACRASDVELSSSPGKVVPSVRVLEAS